MRGAVVIPADGAAYQLEVPEETAAQVAILQKLVGGFIEAVRTPHLLTLFCNEEGKIDGLPANWRATHLFGELLQEHDYLAGTVVILGPVDENGETLGLENGDAEAIIKAAGEISDTDCRRWAKWHNLRLRKSKATPAELELLLVEEEELRQEGIEEMLGEDLAKPEQFWGLSCADGDRPKGQQFLGVAIVKGGGMQEAIQNAWTMEINPGGQVQAFELPEDRVPDPKFHNRLLSKQELEEGGLA